MTEALQYISQANRNVPGITEYFNWAAIAKDPLPSPFIEENYRQLPWDIMCRHQPFDLDIAKKFEYLIKDKLQTLVLNQNLDTEVLKYFIGRMDWDSAQTHQKFTPELLEKFRDELDMLIVLQHQVLPESFLQSLLQPFIDNKQWEQLRRYLTLAFTYQKVSTNFVIKYLVLEAQINDRLEDVANKAEETTIPVIRTSPIILVDLPTVIRKQQLSEEFIATFCMPVDRAREEVCRSQKMSCAFINQYFDQLHVRRLLKYQQLDEVTQMRCIEKSIARPVMGIKNLLDAYSDPIDTVNVIQNNTEPVVESQESQASKEARFNMANTLIKHQVYSLNLATRVIVEFSIDCDPSWTQMLWGNIFIRSLSPIGSEAYLGFSPDTIRNSIMPHVNWDMIATCEMTTEQINTVIEVAAVEMPWYLFIKKHCLTENQIETLHEKKALGPTDWWLVLTIERPEDQKLTYPFVKKYEDRTHWWTRVRDPAEFYGICLQAIDNLDNFPGQNISSHNDLRTFLRDFVNQADWKHILRYEELPEWFMRLFGHPTICKKIEMYWWKISRWQKLNLSFINNNINRLDLQIILGYHDMPESFIVDKIPFFTKDNWDAVARHQKLSDEFRDTYSEFLDEALLAGNPNL